MIKALQYFIISAIIPIITFSQSQFRFDINRIVLPINNRGILADVNIDPSGQGGKLDDVIILFSGGFFMSGYSGDSIWSNAVSSASLVQDYIPGTIGSLESDSRNRIYSVNRSDNPFGAAWQNWIDAVSLGASFYDGDTDGIYNPIDLNSNGIWDINEDKPDILGDLTAWCVFNDGLPAPQRRYSDVQPQGIEIQQTVFCYDSLNAVYPNLGNTIFVRYRINNKGTQASVLDSVIFGLWADIDIGMMWNSLGDKIGSDTIANSVYAYTNPGNTLFGINPPPVYLTYLQFPHSYIPGETYFDSNLNGIFELGIDTPLDTAKYYCGEDLGIKKLPGAKNINNSSSMGWVDADIHSGDPKNKYEVRHYLRALLRNGNIVDPCNWVYTIIAGGFSCSEINPYYWVSGDPVDSVGWLWKTGSDIRVMSNTGAFQLIKNEPVEIICAYTSVRGLDALNSITVTREKVKAAINHYKSNFGQFSTNVDYGDLKILSEFRLHQNSPNLFNPSTKISWQSPVSSRQVLKIFDVLGNKVATLVNEYKPAGTYEVEFTANNLPSGIYFYTLRAGDYHSSRKMLLLK